MAMGDGLQSMVDRLVRKYGNRGREATRNLEYWLSGRVPFAEPEMLRRHLQAGQVDLLFDAFWQVLPFGTGGRRGRVGYGANRLNPATVAMTVQGHCHYLRAAFPGRRDLTVVVANDVRVFKDLAGTYRFLGDSHPLLGTSSRSLGRLACEIYAGNGMTAYFAMPRLADAVISTPELSFVIGRLGTAGGINLSASHNPPDDNGIKVYDAFGSQPVAPEDQALMDAMREATAIRSQPFAEALADGLVRPIPEELHQDYLAAYLELYGDTFTPRRDLPVVYTPLCGCGLKTVGDLLGRLNFPVRTPPHQDADGSFSVIPFKAPNPEVPQATAPARDFADEIGSGLVLSSDPDADRVGLEVRQADGSWAHLDGNQIAAILGYFLMLDPEGPRRKGLVVETLVTTRILGRIVEKAGDSQIIDDLLVGFKYVADVLKSLERTGRYGQVAARPGDLVLAAEESHGVIMIPTIRDKDAAPACMMLAALYQKLRLQGRTLLDYYVEILEQLGGYADVGRSIAMAGAGGVSRRDRLMASLRDAPPRTLAGHPVRHILDYWDQERFGPFLSQSDKLPRNVIRMSLDDFVVTVRPSGTEAKLKFYCQLAPRGLSSLRGMDLLAEVSRQAESLARQVYRELLARLDLELGSAGLLLPDIVDVDRKREFEQTIQPQLHAALAGSGKSSLQELLDWLRRQASGMTPGADPLPALKAPIACLCDGWKAELAANPVFGELNRWARQ